MYITKDGVTKAAPYHAMTGPTGLLARREPFEGRTMSAFWAHGGQLFTGGPIFPPRFVVMSYSTVIAIYRPDNNTLYLNERDYSHTTRRTHQGYAEAWLNHPHDGPVVVAPDEGTLLTVSREDE